MKEYDLQKTCVTWFRLKYQNRGLGLLVSIPNEGRKNAHTGARLKASGLCAGIPDMFIVKKGESRILFIELKTQNANSKLSNTQKEIHLLLMNLGQTVLVIRSIDHFIRIVDSWFLSKNIS